MKVSEVTVCSRLCSLLPTPDNRNIWRRERRLREMGLRLIQARRAEREKGAEKEDLLGLMLAAQDEQADGAAGKGMTDQQLVRTLSVTVRSLCFFACTGLFEQQLRRF